MKNNIQRSKSGIEKQKSYVSIDDVAKLAGCAPATVSRRLNNPKLVNKKTTTAIDKAIEELGYVRNASARALRVKRSRLVGAIIPTLRHSIYAEMMEGLQQTLAQAGFALVHNTSNYDLDEELRQARTLVERGVEAVVLVGTKHKPAMIDLLGSRGVTSIATYALHDGFEFTSIGFDNRKAAHLAAGKLCDLGHRRFAMICGILRNNDRARARLEGFLSALEERGVSRQDVAVREARYSIQDGQRAADEVLAEANRCTAIFCGSDIIAVGAIHACRSRGLRIPYDISIVGFDNLEIAAYTNPPLSTLNVPAFAMGEEAANHIINSQPGNPSIRRVELQVSYVERESTAPPPR